MSATERKVLGGVLFMMCASGSAHARGTVASGDWGDAIWDGAEPVASDEVDVVHAVTVTQLDEEASTVGVTPPGSLHIESGSLTTIFTGLNPRDAIYGNLTLSGGRYNTINIVEISANATFLIRGGAFTLLAGNALRFGPLGDGTLVIEGNAAAILVSNFRTDTSIGGGGRANVRIRPTGNGALSPIDAFVSADLASSSRLIVDPQYPVSVGDSWVVLTYEQLTGTFGDVSVVPAGVTVDVDYVVGKAVTVIVTAAPDTTPPLVTDIVATPPQAAAQTVVSISFNAESPSDTINSVKVNGNEATFTGAGGAADYTYSYEVTGSDVIGPATIEVTATDAANNAGVTTNSTALEIIPVSTSTASSSSAASASASSGGVPSSGASGASGPSSSAVGSSGTAATSSVASSSSAGASASAAASSGGGASSSAPSSASGTAMSSGATSSSAAMTSGSTGAASASSSAMTSSTASSSTGTASTSSSTVSSSNAVSTSSAGVASSSTGGGSGSEASSDAGSSGASASDGGNDDSPPAACACTVGSAERRGSVSGVILAAVVLRRRVRRNAARR